MSVAAIILAAGRGDRVGGQTPKQFLDLGGHLLMQHSLLAFESCDRVDSIVLVLPRDRPRRADQAADLPKVIAVTNGGETRQASVGQGLICIPGDASVVVVHDAARPLVREPLIRKVADALTQDWDGVAAAVEVEDALKEVSSEGELLGARPRAGLWRAQTPQVFRREALEESLARADAEGASYEDCSEMVRRAGYRVRVVEGDPSNLKVTRRADLALCESILAAWVPGRDSSGRSGP
jgi:2-C-methyl-D-erythritol 4-phosphate cytidylyltransferase